MQNHRPMCPERPRVRALEESVRDRIESLLARVEGVRRGSDLPTYFDARGEAEANRIAETDETPTQMDSARVPLGSLANHGLPEEPRDTKLLTRHFTAEAQRRAETIARKDSEMDWRTWSEQEAARLTSEREAGWDETLDRNASEDSEPAKTWDEVCEREAAKLRTGRTDSL